MSALASRLSSPRFQRQLFWGSRLVLLAGGLAGLIAFVWTGPQQKKQVFVPKPAQIAPKEKTVPFDPKAKEVGGALHRDGRPAEEPGGVVQASSRRALRAGASP